MIRVNLGLRSYDIAVNEPGGFAAFAQQRIASRKAYLIADANIAAYAERLFNELTDAGFTCRLTTVPPGEASKSQEQLAVLYSRLSELPADRQTAVIAIGGGVVGDLAGFASATYNRGLPLVMVPTTLLAMVDSSVGGKVGINLPQGKNLIGAFHQPAGVWIDIDSLKTLPEREYRSGLAEVVKYGVILDADFFAWLEMNADAVLNRQASAVARLVTRSCELKASVVERDEREEAGLRIILNYGHTFAHAFETVSGYGHWLHGEAVAAGMVCASRLAERLHMIGADVTQRQVAILKGFGLPTEPPTPPRHEDWLAVMSRDKKTQSGKLRFVLPKRIGEVTIVNDVHESDVLDACEPAGLSRRSGSRRDKPGGSP